MTGANSCLRVSSNCSLGSSMDLYIDKRLENKSPRLEDSWSVLKLPSSLVTIVTPAFINRFQAFLRCTFCPLMTTSSGRDCFISIKPSSVLTAVRKPLLFLTILSASSLAITFLYVVPPDCFHCLSDMPEIRFPLFSISSCSASDLTDTILFFSDSLCASFLSSIRRTILSALSIGAFVM